MLLGVRGSLGQVVILAMFAVSVVQVPFSCPGNTALTLIRSGPWFPTWFLPVFGAAAGTHLAFELAYLPRSVVRFLGMVGCFARCQVPGFPWAWHTLETLGSQG